MQHKTQLQLPQDCEPTLRVTTSPSEANPKGDIFGGWLMSQIDIAGAIAAVSATSGPVATVAVNSLQFIHPLYPHDVVSFYTSIQKCGKTSIIIDVEVFAQREFNLTGEVIKISNATLVYVAIEKPGIKREIKL